MRHPEKTGNPWRLPLDRPWVDPRLAKALRLMRNIVRSPIGTYPERDREIKRAWESAR